MSGTLEFYFDFSSPYSYLASAKIDSIAEKHGLMLEWRPFLLGPVFKLTNTLPLISQLMKGDYTTHDLARTARLYGLPFKLPSNFPFGSVTASRAFYFVEQADPAAAVQLAKALFHAAFGEGRDICPIESVVAIGADMGLDPDSLSVGINSFAIKKTLKSVVDIAIEREVFGAPFFFVNGEKFWGNDKLDQVDLWLTKCGW